MWTHRLHSTCWLLEWWRQQAVVSMYAWERGGAADEEQATSPQAGSTRHPFLPWAHTLIFNHLEVYPSTPSTKCNNLTKEPHSWVRFFFFTNSRVSPNPPRPSTGSGVGLNKTVALNPEIHVVE